MKKRLIIKREILRKALNILGVCTVGLIAACAKYGAEISTFKMNLKGVPPKTPESAAYSPKLFQFFPAPRG